jgi:thiamine kinase-like enzyme
MLLLMAMLWGDKWREWSSATMMVTDDPTSSYSSPAIVSSVGCKTLCFFSLHMRRDLKPENLLMTGRDDSSADLKLVDFGFAAKVSCIIVASICCAE